MRARATADGRAASAKPTVVHIDGAAQQNAAGAEEAAASAGPARKVVVFRLHPRARATPGAVPHQRGQV